jgi:hypothetical protein
MDGKLMARGWRALVVAAAMAVAACGGGSGTGAQAVDAGAAAKADEAQGFTGTGTYWDPAAPGTGMFFEAQGGVGVITLYMYEEDGRSVWYSATGPFGQQGGQEYRFSGTLRRYQGGQWATSTTPQVPTSTPAGSVTAVFNGDEARITVPGRSFTMRRFFPAASRVPPVTNQLETGIYWNPAESGRGYTVETNGNQALIGVFHYERAANPIWHLVVVPVIKGGSYSDPALFTTYQGGQTLSGSRAATPTALQEGVMQVNSNASPCSGYLQFPNMTAFTNIRRFSFGVLPDSEVCRATAGVRDDSWLSFDLTSIKLVAQEGESAEAAIVATSSRQIAEKVNVAIIDDKGVFKGASVTPQSQLVYRARLAISNALPPGRYEGALVVKLCFDDPLQCKRPVDGPRSVPYEVTVQPWKAERSQRRLLASETGVAFTSMADRSRLTRTLVVTENKGNAAAWRAASDSAWLKVTASGTAGGALALAADPSALPAGTVSYATVRVTSDDPAVAGDSIQVGLWKSTASASTGTVSLATYVAEDGIVADPIRPYAYVVEGKESIAVVNAYTASRVATLTAPGAQLTTLVVSPDGQALYAMDDKSSLIRVFDLRDGRALPPVKLARTTPQNRDFIHARPNGTGVLIVNDGSAYRASDGQVLALDLGTRATMYQDITNSYLAASPDGQRLYGTGARNVTPRTPWYVDMDYSDAGGGKLSHRAAVNAQFPVGQDGRLDKAYPMIVAPDGARLYTREIARCTVWSANLVRIGTVATSRGDHTGGMAWTSNGRLMCVWDESAGVRYGFTTMHGEPIETLVLYPNYSPYASAVTGDALMLVAAKLFGSSGGLAFVPLKP